MTTVLVTDVSTPVGDVTIATEDDRVVALAFADHFDRVAAAVPARTATTWVRGTTPAAGALRRYVDGDLDALDDLVVDGRGTPFRRRVWTALRTIPVGATWSYQDLADAIGSPAATRAVGSANGANPTWLVVPCHRVIRADGTLGGYGGGLERKAWLLEHEGVAVPTRTAVP